jgi:hypothetical protein
VIKHIKNSQQQIRIKQKMHGSCFASWNCKGAHYQFLSPQNEQPYMTPRELLSQTTLKITEK